MSFMTQLQAIKGTATAGNLFCVGASRRDRIPELDGIGQESAQAADNKGFEIRRCIPLTLRTVCCRDGDEPPATLGENSSPGLKRQHDRNGAWAHIGRTMALGATS
jgi:hypothetical protein